MKKLLAPLLIFILIVLMGCGASVEEKTFVLEEDGGKMELVYTYKDDKVISQTTHNEYGYADLGFENKEEAEEFLSPTINEYESLDGVDYNIEFNDDVMIEDIDIDYEALDFEKAKGIPGFDFEGDTDNGISMSKTTEYLESSGFEVQ